ncbi:MAG: hypothetical protein K6F71_09920 [Ruminococcus sp.]|uniref:hypothetical protein n=1 Tax=Ruminococcus sp. TaxID=41978 RepID=UPI0025F148DF|nr:hypothetical protein [Ruminococcus sp.]MCR5541116.1 hypothetical protein [Ruminococcus sp.]
MELIFNELSTGYARSRLEASEQFIDFVKLFAKLTSADIGFSKDLHTYFDLNGIELYPGYYTAEWRNQDIDKDVKMLFKRICDRQIVEENKDEEIEVSFEKSISLGLTTAYINDYTVISINDRNKWNPYIINCELYSLSSDETTNIKLKNISNVDTLNNNLDDITSQKEQELFNYPFSYLVENLEKIFCNLIFHKIAKDQLINKVEKQHLHTVLNKLKLLDDYFSTWDGCEFDQNAFPPRSISRESTETLARFKEKHEFSFDDIGTVEASFHYRYTGGIPGRIYFVPYSLLRKGLICTLTTKLPTVTEPKLTV